MFSRGFSIFYDFWFSSFYDFLLAANAPGKRVLLVRAVLRLWRDGRVQIGLISVVEIVMEATNFLRRYCTFWTGA